MFDNSLKKEKYISTNKDYNLKNNLLRDRKIDKSFLEKIKFLTLEELIYLKLETAAIGLSGKLFNFPIYKFIQDISKEACVHYALSSTKSYKGASMVLGIPKTELTRLIKYYNIHMKRNN